MQRGMTCEQAYQEVYPYLDRELSDTELEVVRQHLEACPPCAHLFQFEGTIVRYIREHGARERCPAAVARTILSGFRARIVQRYSR
jgi:mycothiol system anti-sigma-R factor